MDDQRRRRADAGQVRATARDAVALSWVVEMYGMPLDLLRRLTGTSEGAMRQLLWRWRRAGWVESGQLGAGPSWVWATRLGIEQFGRHPYDPHRPSVAKVAHHRAVAAVRLLEESRRRDAGFAWESERELRYLLGQRRGSDAQREHLVDGIGEWDAPDGSRIRFGYEIELSPKPVGQLKNNILAGLDMGGLVQVAWFVTDRTRALVERAVNEVSAGKRIVLRDVPEEGVLSG